MQGGVLRKCFELSGVVPLAVFVPVHVLSYAGALFGSREFGVASRESAVMLALDVFLVWVPLAFHALFGARIAFTPLEPEPSERTRSLLLRLTGAGALVFVLAHVFWFERPLLSGERAPEDLREVLAARLSSTVEGWPLAAALHVFGLAMVSVHLALGLARFVERWGLGSATRARWGAGLGSGILFALGAATVIELATGSAIPNFLSR